MVALAVASLGVLAGGIPTAAAAPTVAIVDSFDSPQSHGNLVDAILQKAGSDTVKLSHQIRDDVTGLVFTEDQAEFNEFITDILQEMPAQALRQVNQQLNKIARDPNSQVRTINLSLALSKASRFQLLDHVFTEDLDARARMQAFMGLPESASEQAFRHKLVETVEKLYDQSPQLQRQRKDYEKTVQQLAKRNITVVVAAGNEGELQAAVDRPGFYQNLFSTGQTITVGATDANFKLWNESNPGADVLARGVAVPITIQGETLDYDGTSFAVPKVAHEIDQAKEQNPLLTRDQLLKLLTTP